MIEIKCLEVSEFGEVRSGIAELFKICFGETLDRQLWEWAYLKNPTGRPIIVVALVNGNVIGHYAMIPIPFIQENLQYLGYLSMTTMVHPDYRKYGLFQELASIAYANALPKTFVYGFPNSNSTPGFKKRLEWEISDKFHIATVSSQNLINYLSSIPVNSQGSLDISDNEFIEWRLSKPGTKYYAEGKLIYKDYDGEIDILTTDQVSASVFMGSKKSFNLLSSDESLMNAATALKKYQFGYRNFNSSINLSLLNPNLLMSDVF
jgi:hypothetical protein